LVYSVVESAGRSGAWVKNIKSKLNLHHKNVDNSIKTLTQRGYIKSMSNVKYPSRKMYILAALQPSEDATGGAWFTDGVLDQELLETLATALERKISEMSWKQVNEPAENSTGLVSTPSRKRKEPCDGLEAEIGKEKMPRLADGADAGDSGPVPGEPIYSEPITKKHGLEARSKKTYVPHPAGYQKYPTLRELTNFVNSHDILQSGSKIPENNIAQLLEVMVYDDKIIKVQPSVLLGSTSTMYRARKNVAQLSTEMALLQRVRNTDLDEDVRLKAIREIEVQRLGKGGMTEIPCGRCPVFDMCEVGAPVNPDNCQYFDEWFKEIENSGQGMEDGLSW
jgi:DNA-directed RNA polymerase III subunit RPC6